MSEPESRFPTISDMHKILAELIAEGLGALPVQVLVAPDSTLQALARHAGAKDDAKPALMIEFGGDTGRIPVSILSTDRWENTKPRDAVQ